MPSDGTSLLFMTAQFSGPGAQAEKVAMESVDRIRLSRAPHMKDKYLLSNGAQSVYKSLEYLRRVAKKTGSSLVREVANEGEFISERCGFCSLRTLRPGKVCPPRRFVRKECPTR